MVDMHGGYTGPWIVFILGLVTIASRASMSLSMAIYRVMCLKTTDLVKYRISSMKLALILIIMANILNGLLVYG